MGKTQLQLKSKGKQLTPKGSEYRRFTKKQTNKAWRRAKDDEVAKRPTKYKAD